MTTIYLSLGGNIGDRLSYLSEARKLINNNIGNIYSHSSIYETDSRGYTDKKYLNQIIEIKSKLFPYEILIKTQKIEKQLGRGSKSYKNSNGIIQYSARTIDIDILFYGDKIITEDKLVIPHPLLHKRNFVLVPLNEIAPSKKHPVFGLYINELLKVCSDKKGVKEIQKVLSF